MLRGPFLYQVSKFARNLPATRGVRLFSGMSSAEIAQFFNLQKFAVVGASPDREKFGNKVLRAYLLKGYTAIPVNKKVAEIEGVPTVDSLSTIAKSDSSSVSSTGVSIITPPVVTKSVIEEGYSLGYRWFFLQPGTHDEPVRAFYHQLQEKDPSLKVIENCVLVQLRTPAL